MGFDMVPEENRATFLSEMVDGIFAEADENGDGVLTKEEVKNAMKAQNGGQDPKAEELEQQFAMLDTNQDGKISKEEFSAFLKGMLGW